MEFRLSELTREGASACPENLYGSLDKFSNFFQRPNLIGNASFHHWSNPQGWAVKNGNLSRALLKPIILISSV
jgi:hypothetical protein